MKIIKLIDYGFSFWYKNTNIKYFGTLSYTMHKGDKYNPELVLKKKKDIKVLYN